jgi:hypothetical protein
VGRGEEAVRDRRVGPGASMVGSAGGGLHWWGWVVGESPSVRYKGCENGGAAGLVVAIGCAVVPSYRFRVGRAIWALSGVFWALQRALGKWNEFIIP